MAESRSARFTLSSAAGLRLEKAHVVQERDRPTSQEIARDMAPVQQVTGNRISAKAGPKPSRPALAGEERKWHVVDADGLVVGRAASIIANVLRGKHKLSFTPHVDCGDNVVVINADKIRFTSNKAQKRIYYKHTGFAGGIKSVTAAKVLEGRFPERVLEKAVERMIPRGPLGREQMRNLRIFKGTGHPHVAENPQVLKDSGTTRKIKGKS